MIIFLKTPTPWISALQEVLGCNKKGTLSLDPECDTKERLKAFFGPDTYHLEHPINDLLRFDGSVNAVQINTESAIRQFFRMNTDEKTQLAEKINKAKTPNYKDAASAISEIRAWGLLKQAGFQVDPIPEKDSSTPDFKVNSDFGEPFYVEVVTKLINDAEQGKLQEQREGFLKRSQKSKSPIFMEEHVIFPAGRHSPNPLADNRPETTAENVASKISGAAGAKNKKKQYKANNAPTYLWLDCQWGLFSMGGNQVDPVSFWNEQASTCGLWHAFYGKCGDYLFDNLHPGGYLSYDHQKMRFKGLFYQEDVSLTGAIISCPYDTVIFDHPDPVFPLSKESYSLFMCLKRFNYAKSYMGWPHGLSEIATRIQSEKIGIKRLVEERHDFP